VSGSIAVFNAGSSSIKFGLYGTGAEDGALYRGEIEEIGVSPRLQVSNARGETVAERTWRAESFDHHAATDALLEILSGLAAGAPLAAAGHRVVHGGARYAAPIRIDGEAMAFLAGLTPLAPLHQPHNLAPIAAIAKAFPNLPQVACFDTAFHHDQPPVAQLFGLPRRYAQAGVRRYGFHGLSYEYVSGQLAELDPDAARGRVIIAHLGAGASLCALKAGRSIATTMGFTTADGLLMATRCGAIDPGVLLYLMNSEGLDARGLEDLIYHRSGLLGVSGISPDMRTLRASSDQQAGEAIALFVYRIVCEIGALAAALGGLDALVFTAGIGENDAATRAEVAAGCAWLGLALDPARNGQGRGRIHTQGSRVCAWVIPTDEEGMIARHTRSTLAPSSNHGNPMAASMPR